jgi:hypothetical protein
VIAFTCPSCGLVYNLDASMLGRRVKCKCGEASTVKDEPVVVLTEDHEAEAPRAIQRRVELPPPQPEVRTVYVMQQPAVPPRIVGAPACHACGGSMRKTVMSSGNCSGIAGALLVLTAGLVIFVALPVIGWIIGGLLIVCALFMGGKRQKIWRCNACRAFIPPSVRSSRFSFRCYPSRSSVEPTAAVAVTVSRTA